MSRFHALVYPDSTSQRTCSMQNKKSVYGTLPREELASLLAITGSVHWKQALRDLDLPVMRSKIDWFVDESRANPYLIMPCKGTGMALDIGAGSGIISAVAARRFSSVIAFEFLPELCNFMAKRFAQDNIQNVSIVRGNALAIPFAQNIFDLAIVNGVLEWVPDFVRSKNPEEVQVDFLRQVYSTLKDKGRIGIAIENRYYYLHFLGQTPHNEPPFVTIMPRWMADPLAKRKTGKPYRNYIYSYWGYKRLLQKSGFKNIEIYILLPDYYNPVMMVSTGSPKALRGLFSKYNLDSAKAGRRQSFIKMILRALLACNIYHFFGHSFLVTGEK